MPVNLTLDQEAKVAAKRKGTLPTYYNSKIKVRQSISQDTEAALILLPSVKKEQASKYFQTFADKENLSSDYDKVLDLFVQKQLSNVQIANLSLTTIFLNFTQFKDSLLGQGEETLASGCSPIIESLNLPLAKIKSTFDTLQYRELHFQAAQRLGSSNMTEDQKRELRSWVPVLVSYP